MLDALKQSVIGQYEASLAMLEDCFRQCPDEAWEGEVGDFAFWHVAYHAIFYTDLYLSENLDSYEPREYCRENYQFFGRLPFPPYESFVAEDAYDRQTLVEYVGHCRQKVRRSVGEETAESLQGPCGFWWYKIPRGEFHLNNIRHVQHHAAQMSLYLKRAAGVQIEWVGGGGGG